MGQVIDSKTILDLPLKDGMVVMPLDIFGAVFVLLQILPPVHRVVGANLPSRTAAWLYDQLTTVCIRPPGMGHLENASLTTDLTMARDFDLGRISHHATVAHAL